MFLHRDLQTERNGHYKVGPRFAGLQQGRVCIGLDLHTDVGVAVKVERINKKNGSLRQEIQVYDLLWQSKSARTGIPRFLFGGTLGHHRYVVLDRLGKNLEQLRLKCGGSLSLKSVLLVGMHAMNAIKSIHDAGLIHGNIEPRNLIMGRYVHDEATVYMVDYKHARRYYGAPPGDDDIPFSVGLSPERVTPFTSRAYDSGTALGRKHDLESLGYTLLYLFYGRLSWQADENHVQSWCVSKRICQDLEADMAERKLQANMYYECAGLPFEMTRYFQYVNDMGKHSKPDYELLSSLFENAYFRMGAADDCVYDWTPSYEQYPA